MENGKTEVTLIGPAKVGGRYRQAGAKVFVTDDERAHLVAAGALPDDVFGLSMEPIPLASDFDAAVADAVSAAIADREANWSTAMDHFQTMAEDRQNDLLGRIQELETDLANEALKVTKAEGDLAGANAKITDLETQLAAAKAASATTPKKTTTK